MSSRPFAPLWIAFCCAAALTGCRDLTLPEPIEPAVGELSIYVVGLGTDGPLAGATVVIENSDYVEPAFAGSWTAVSGSDGIARFPARLRGIYDVNVSSGEEPQDAPGRATPAWTSHGVDLTSGNAVAAYPGLPVEARFDWPELAAVGISPRDFQVDVSFKVEESHTASQRISDDGSGKLTGMIPWAGELRAIVSVSTNGFNLRRYEPRETWTLEAGSLISVPSPLTPHDVQVLGGGEALQRGSIMVQLDTSWLSFDPPYRLDQTVDVQDGQARFFLMEPALLECSVLWVDGPHFLPRTLFLSEDTPAPDVIDLGTHTVTFDFVDAAGQPVPGANLSVLNEAAPRTWADEEEAGRIVAFLDSGSYGFQAYLPLLSRSVPEVIDVDRDLEVTLVLDQEWTP